MSLLEAGADADLWDDADKTPLDLAERENKEIVRQLLLELHKTPR